MTFSGGGESKPEQITIQISLKPDKISVVHIIVNIYLSILQPGKMKNLMESLKTLVYFPLLQNGYFPMLQSQILFSFRPRTYPGHI